MTIMLYLYLVNTLFCVSISIIAIIAKQMFDITPSTEFAYFIEG